MSRPIEGVGPQRARLAPPDAACRLSIARGLSEWPSAPRPTRRTRRGLAAAVAAVAVALLTFPSVALASPPVQLSDVLHATRPDPITVDDATVDFNISFSTLTGARGDISYDGPLGELTGIEDFARMTGNRLVGTFLLIDVASGQPYGFAEFEFEFTPAGDVTSSERVMREGNHRSVATFTEQEMVVSGHLTMPDGSVFPVSEAPGARLTADIWSTDPRSTILDGTQTLVEANRVLGDTPVTFRAHVTALDAGGVVYLSTEDGEILGRARPELTDGHMTLSVVLERHDRSVAGTADVALDITTVGSSTYFEETDFSRQRVTRDELAVTGSMELTLDGVTHQLSLGDADVTAARLTWHGIQYPFAEDTEG